MEILSMRSAFPKCDYWANRELLVRLGSVTGDKPADTDYVVCPRRKQE